MVMCDIDEKKLGEWWLSNIFQKSCQASLYDGRRSKKEVNEKNQG